MFDQQKMAQEFFNMSKSYWMMTMDMVSNFEEQNERMLNTMMDQGVIAQDEGKKMFKEWLNRTKQTREEFSQAMQDNWKKAETMFTTAPKTRK